MTGRSRRSSGCVIVVAMSSARRWLAGLLVVVFAAVEVFASAPQLHLHQGEAFASARQQSQTLTTHSNRPPKPNDCIACRTANVATTLTAWLGVTPPRAHQTLALVASTLSPASEFIDDARGRAPPTC